MVQGKRVALVGNLTPDTDLSEEIDNHDIVIRINHFYNYDSNLVGKKLDMLFVTPTDAWKRMSADKRHEALIQEKKPKVFAVKHWLRIDKQIKENHFKGCKIYKFEDDMLQGSQIYTTGTASLKILSNCENFTCDCYCFSEGDKWNQYIATEAQHYSKNKDKEAEIRQKLLSTLENKKMFSNEIYPVITVRKGSSLKDKNIRIYKDNKSLLQICIEKAIQVFGSVTVLADDPYYCQLAEEYGATVPYIDSKVEDNDDVTKRLKVWRDRCGIHGRIILLQCTSPNIKVESIERIKQLSKDVDYKTVIMSTVPYDDVKYSALVYYDEETGALTQAVKDCPSISIPRQKLRPLYHYNGALTSFMSSQLDKESLFDDATMMPCFIDKSKGLDIDTLEHFNK